MTHSATKTMLSKFYQDSIIYGTHEPISLHTDSNLNKEEWYTFMLRFESVHRLQGDKTLHSYVKLGNSIFWNAFGMQKSGELQSNIFLKYK